jgi:biopolymer transport protein ExbD
MLTTKFKPDEPVVVDTPSSISQVLLPDADIMTITVDKEARVFFGVSNQTDREKMLSAMATKYKIALTGAEVKEFTLTETFGVPVQDLKTLLNSTSSQRAKLQRGIPVDSVNNQLQDWVANARYANRGIRIVIKGDKDADAKVMKQIIDIMQEQNINKFNLITNMEAAPTEL